jgi:pimeloyl-ACP methyl ester carboxylesterase
VTIEHSPLAGRRAEIHYREFGTGRPLLFLHSGWGYHIFPINKQLHELKEYRVLIPDRSGYGASTRPAKFDAGFHVRAAEETFAFMDALGIDDAVVWGHSDGAVIAARMGMLRAERCRGLVLEAFHYARRKVRSREFFLDMVERPEKFGERVCAVLAHEHGEGYWRELLRIEGQTWLEIARLAEQEGEDVFGGRLGEMRVPTVLIHGAGDPRTDDGELAAVHDALPEAEIRMIATGEHCPHNESKAAAEFTQELMRALEGFEQKKSFDIRTKLT